MTAPCAGLMDEKEWRRVKRLAAKHYRQAVEIEEEVDEDDQGGHA